MGQQARRKREYITQKEMEQKPFFYIGTSQISGNHMIYLKHGDQKEGLSAHKRYSDALYGKQRCEECLRSFEGKFDEQPLAEWKEEFIERLSAEFDYPDDSITVQLTGEQRDAFLSSILGQQA